VNQALGQMEKMMQQNSTLVQEAGTIVESLEAQARVLTDTVQVFKLEREDPEEEAAASATPASVPMPRREPVALMGRISPAIEGARP
jgi:hypothetical protein